PRRRSRAGLAEFAHERPPSPLRLLAELPLMLVLAAVVALLLKAFVAQAFSIPSSSMEPQLLVGDRVAVSRTAYRLHDPNRGDIIVFHAPGTQPDTSALPARLARDVLEGVGALKPSETELIKRVVALEGEVVEARGGRVYVNGRELVEPYLPPDVATADFAAVTVPEDFVFVLGDNRGNSQDSRFIGPIPVDSIVGRAIARIWPVSRWAHL
nr:signal peptidase I [Acidimicrobiia bacterium]